MDNFDPTQIDANGHPQIASHYMPLTGPYDSKDWDILEYQILLMKISGIDGVIADWYGSSNYTDYPIINQSTTRLFEQIKKAGLVFSVCYEDQTIKHMIEAHRLDEINVYDQGKKDLLFLQDNWFIEETYLKFEDRPVLLTFGPQYLTNGADWESLFLDLSARPVLVTLDKHYVPAAESSFPWPPMWASQDGVLSSSSLENYLDGFYQKAENYSYLVAGAFPGFHDIYQQAGVGNSYGYLDSQDGKIFELTLQKAIDQNPNIIQLITWNDYGEGTNIEPTEEFGYKYLEMIQTARTNWENANSGPSGFGYKADDLRLPLKLFNIRKTYDDPRTRAQLDEVYKLLIAGDTTKAAEILANYP